MKTEIYPKNKEHFKKLIPFAQKIISICKEAGVDSVIYGSFAHFYHTKDKTMSVNDIDMMIPEQERNFKKIAALLKKKKIKFRYLPQWETMIINKGKLKVEVDSVGLGYEGFDEKTLFNKEHDKVDFYGMNVKLFKLEHFEKSYISAYLKSTDNKDKIMDKIKRLEKFLGRKINNPISIEKIKNKDLTSAQKKIINNARIAQWGEREKKDFSKDYEPETLWFFLKDNGKVVALGGLRPIKLEYLGKKYSIGGICSFISLVRMKGYGKILVSYMIDYSYKTGNTILGFTLKAEFFRKAGLAVEGDFIKRFVYIKSNGEKVYDNEGDGIYYEGKDKIISKILKGKKSVLISVEHW